MCTIEFVFFLFLANVYSFCKLFSNTLFFIICFARQFFMLSSTCAFPPSFQRNCLFVYVGFSCCRICVFLCGVSVCVCVVVHCCLLRRWGPAPRLLQRSIPVCSTTGRVFGVPMLASWHLFVCCWHWVQSGYPGT